MRKWQFGWGSDKESLRCENCTQSFDFFSRRHHCRNCGGSFCGGCSNLFVPSYLLRKMHETVKDMEPQPPERDVVEKKSEQGVFFTTRIIAYFFDKLSVAQRVCAKCYESAQSYVTGVSLEPQQGSSKLLTSNFSATVSPVLPGTGRERKVYVISLRNSSPVDRNDHFGLSAVFEELERVIGDISGASHKVDEPHRSCSHSATSIVTPSTESTPTMYSSDRSVLEGTFSLGEAATDQWGSRRCVVRQDESPRKNHHRVVLHIPILAPESQGGSGIRQTTKTVHVHAQLVGLTHERSFNGEVLQQETIGTDAYVILPDEELGALAGRCGVASEVNYWRNVPNSATESPPASNYTSHAPVQHRGNAPVRASQRVGRRYDWSASSTSMDAVRGVWETIEQFSGAEPICAVIDYTSCHRVRTECTTTREALRDRCSSDGAYTLGSGPIFVHCHKSEQQKYPSVKEQATALYRALLLVVGEVVLRDMLQQDH